MSADLFAVPRAGVARVALPLPVDTLFDYAVPPPLAAEVEVGRRALVPFERRRLVGVIVETAAEPDPSAPRLRALERVLDPAPALPPSLLAILREEAAEVLCPLGLALAAALPPGAVPRLERRFALTPRGREALRSGAARAVLRQILEGVRRDAPAEASLARRDRPGLERLRTLEREGLVTRVMTEQPPRARPRRVRVARLAEGVDVEAAARALGARAPRQAALLRALAAASAGSAMSGRGGAETAALVAGDAGAARALRALEERGLVRLEERAAPSDVLGIAPARDAAPTLSAEQEAACTTLGDAVRRRLPEHFLLHGVTGSGKTEVYLHALETALREGRQGLVLVPEITLTHQIVRRLRARFGEAVAVLHSGLSASARLEQWASLRGGATPIAVGARSALFAPLDDLGVIVIDEEHDGAYKNDEGFRYHARLLAARRAAAAPCPLLLGSATPSLESRYAAQQGRLRRLVLSHRIGGRPLPAVELVDLGRERARLPRGRLLLLTRPLRQAMAEVLAAGGQTLLFLNRRGFSTQIACMACGFVMRCKHCDIALVFHAGEGRLRCHYCDFRIAPPEVCHGCGSDENALLGAGTERLEEEVRSLLPEARVARLDRDSAARRGTVERVLDGLRDGSLDVVLGTQMLAKGHDFPGVRLVGVVNADLGLQFPDFRAAERTFQLLTQVAGRAGRGGAPGRVIVQTWMPDHYAVRPVVDHAYERFYAEEIAHRAALGYPPCGHLAHVLVSGTEPEAARRAAGQLALAARGAAEPLAPEARRSDAAEVLGPVPAPLARLRGRHRFQILVKGADEGAVRDAARRVVAAAARLPRELRVGVDLNPFDML